MGGLEPLERVNRFGAAVPPALGSGEPWPRSGDSRSSSSGTGVSNHSLADRERARDVEREPPRWVSSRAGGGGTVDGTLVGSGGCTAYDGYGGALGANSSGGVSGDGITGLSASPPRVGGGANGLAACWLGWRVSIYGAWDGPGGAAGCWCDDEAAAPVFPRSPGAISCLDAGSPEAPPADWAGSGGPADIKDFTHS